MRTPKQVEQALAQLTSHTEVCDEIIRRIVPLAVGRLRMAGVDPDALVSLKMELRSFNNSSRSWSNPKE